MKLLTKEIEEKFKKLGSQAEEKDPIAVAKFFYPAGSATWWATEMTYVIRRKKNGSEDPRMHRVRGKGCLHRSEEMQSMCESADCQNEDSHRSMGTKEPQLQGSKDGQRIHDSLCSGSQESKQTGVCDEEYSRVRETPETQTEAGRDASSQERSSKRRQSGESGVDDEDSSQIPSHDEDKYETLDVPSWEINKYHDFEVVDQIFFGYASLFGDHNDEWGSFSLAELESFRGLGGLGIERDKWFKPQPMSKACPKAVGKE